MSTLDDLIKEIPNVDLRRRIAEEVKALRSTKKFGLVFDPHQPECTPLYDTPIKRDSIVALKAGKLDDLYRVQNIDGDNVNCLKEPQTNETYSFKLDELVSVARFGEPIYPYLQQLDKVISAPDSELWHILIESENYHALQLLQYVFTDKKVDCIYIDPPYNTGARDWNVYTRQEIDSRGHTLDLGLIRDSVAVDFDELPDPRDTCVEILTKLAKASALISATLEELKASGAKKNASLPSNWRLINLSDSFINKTDSRKKIQRKII